MLVNVFEKEKDIVMTHEVGVLMCPYSEEDALIFLSHMNPAKASGKDEMPVFFYKHFWHIVGV